MKTSITVMLWGITFALLAILFYLTLAKKNYAYVDAQKLANGYKGMVEARKEFGSQVNIFRARVDSLKQDFDTRFAEYASQKGKLTAKERKLMEELLEAKQSQLVNYQNVVNEKIQSADQELTAKVLGKINSYIKDYGEKRGYQVILSATQYGNIAYANPEIDVTAEILEGLNASYAGNE